MSLFRHPPMTDTRKVLRLMKQAAARAQGEDSDGVDGVDGVGYGEEIVEEEAPARSEGVRYTRDRLHEASGFADAGTMIPPGARLKPVKQAMLTFVRPVTSHQVPFNAQVLAAINGLAGEIERCTSDLARQEQRAMRLQAGIATTDLTVDDLNDTAKQLSADVDELAAEQQRLSTTLTSKLDSALSTTLAKLTELQATIERVQADQAAALARETAGLRSQLQAVRAKQDLVFRAAREALPNGFDIAQLGELSRELSTGYEELYEDLEDTFRGSREHIMDLATEYIDDVRSVPGRGPVVDVGCGRGEWLEVLRDAEIPAYGVDVNEVVVERCRARGLDVRAADALVHLREEPEGSVRAVTSFHVVEHLSLDTLVQLIDAALVALRPGGLLIFETPNPTNVNVGAASFYLDPTHLKPLHPQFCEFLVLSRGFAEAEVRFLHPEDAPRLTPADLAVDDPQRAQALVDRINWAMFGPLDYAIVARKAGADAREARDAPDRSGGTGEPA